MMMQNYLKELEQDPFDQVEFVERLAWRTVDVIKEDGINTFEPHIIYDTFLQAINDMKLLQERQRKKCDKLELICQEEENRHWQDIAQFQEKNKAAVTLFQDLDERINFVATKVIHLGDQLENINIPRSRAVEAQKLMCYFSEFLSPGPVLTDVFINKDDLFEAADIIQKLHMIAQELPSSKFEDARKKINIKYDEIEKSLIEEFVKAHRVEDRSRMKEIASILSHFKAYYQCINAFLEESYGTFTGKDIFREILPLTEKNFMIMKEVFNTPEQVLSKFVLNIYQLKLQNVIGSALANRSDLDKYLNNLMDLYLRTIQLSKDLDRFNMASEDTFLSKLTDKIYQKYLDHDYYISTEVKCLKEKCTNLLQKFYESKDHQKKPVQSGGLQDLKREMQAIATRANINFQMEDYGGETFLSEELAISILQESKVSFKRCKVLSRPAELANNAFQLFEVLLQYLVSEHIDYAIELGLQGIPIPESRVQNQVYFFDIARQTNVIIHFIDKQFGDSILPLVGSTSKHGECLLKKKFKFSALEQKLDNGIDRSINTVIGWVKILLQNEQKKTDFKPDSELDIMPNLSSQACLKVVKIISTNLAHIKHCLDGRNREFVLNEFGCRFHRVIYEHLQAFQYNEMGAMCVICDINEYRKCVKEIKSPLIDTLFDTLHSLCNLLLVKPENLNQVCSGEHLAALEGSILLNFIQLRSDYKTQKLVNFLKGINS